MKTYNSKTGSNGQRLNLVINEERKEMFFHTCNVFDLGDIYDENGIREVNRLYKDFLRQGYKEVKSSEVRMNWQR